MTLVQEGTLTEKAVFFICNKDSYEWLCDFQLKVQFHSRHLHFAKEQGLRNEQCLVMAHLKPGHNNPGKVGLSKCFKDLTLHYFSKHQCCFNES